MTLLSVIVLPVLLISSIGAVSKIDIHQPAICLKEKRYTKGEYRSINTTAKNFKEFVRNSDIFVDKSLLINILTQNASFVSLTYPPKWGKTINLDMLKTFLELEVDSKGTAKPSNETWAYKFFKHGQILNEDGTQSKLIHPPMISKNESMMNSYLSQYPVIYLNLSSFIPTSYDFDGFLSTFRNRMSAVFQIHNYMTEIWKDEIDDPEEGVYKKVRTQKLLEKFQGIKSGGINSADDATVSLNFLSRVLSTHFNQRVYVLIDDYDALVHKSCFESPSPTAKETKRILDFFHKFITGIFEANETTSMVIVSGILESDIFSHRMSPFQHIHYNMLNRNLRPFYGFTLNEVHQLLTHCFIEHEQTTKYYYYGYRIGDFPEIIIYDPWSLVNFVNDRPDSMYKCIPYRSRNTTSEILHLLNCTQMRHFWQKNLLQLDDAIPVNLPNLMLSNDDATSLKNIINEIESSPNNDRTVTSIFTYLYASGYFTLHVPTKLRDRVTGTTIKIPNEDIRSKVSEVFGKSIFATNDVAKQILEYFQCKEFNDSSTTYGLRELYDYPKSIRNISDEPFRSVHLSLMACLKMSSNYSVSFEKSYTVGSRILKPYIVLQKNDHRAIIEFELKLRREQFYTSFSDENFNCTKKALNRAKEYNTVFENEPFVPTTFMGICFNLNSYLGRIQVDTDPKCD